MSDLPGARNETVQLWLTWDGVVDAGHLALTEIGRGGPVSQRIVRNPVKRLDDVILDFDEAGHLLGIEFLHHRLLPPGLALS